MAEARDWLKMEKDRADGGGMELSAIALQGLREAEGQMEQAAMGISSSASMDATSIDAVDLSSEMIALLSAKELAMVNLKTLETAEEMAKSVIDLMA
jgi:hypothetical protein